MTPSSPASVVPGLRIVAAVDAPWSDVRSVFGDEGDPADCFCRFFKVTSARFAEEDAATKAAGLCGEIERAAAADRRVGPGLLAYLDDEPAGWCALEPRDAYPRLLTSQILRSSAEPRGDEGVWSVTCFVVPAPFRRRGVSRALLHAAVEHARGHGGRILEGYPVDPSAVRVSAGELFHGALAAFLDAGFEIVAQPTPRRAVVSIRL